MGQGDRRAPAVTVTVPLSFEVGTLEALSPWSADNTDLNCFVTVFDQSPQPRAVMWNVPIGQKMYFAGGKYDLVITHPHPFGNAGNVEDWHRGIEVSPGGGMSVMAQLPLHRLHVLAVGHIPATAGGRAVDFPLPQVQCWLFRRGGFWTG